MNHDSNEQTGRFLDLALSRQSVRAYQDRDVEEEKLHQLIEASRLAPSASNGQPWKLIFVTDPALKEQVADATFSTMVSFNKFVPQAPVLVVIAIERTKVITQIGGIVKKRDFPLIDIGIVAEHLCLQAAELGLGTCMLGWFDEQRIKKILHVPNRIRIGLVISLGYPPPGYRLRNKQRKKVEDMSSFNRY